MTRDEMKAITEGTILWQPTEEQIKSSNLYRYMDWLREQKGLSFSSYRELWTWSVEELESFWGTVWEYCDVQATTPYECVLRERKMPGAKWFPGATLNYAKHIFRHARADRPAIIFRSEHVPYREVSWQELGEKTAAIAKALRAMGVKRGDRVVAYMPNIPETVMAFLACASIGAIWSSCSPDFGAGSVIDRFAQIEPTVLFAVDGCQYNGKEFDKMPVVSELRAKLPSLKKTVLLPYWRGQMEAPDEGVVLWDDVVADKAELVYEDVPFDHPLWILYSSGTTGLPKPIVQGHGGILLEHLKALTIAENLTKDSTFFWFTTTGWMMWNFLIGGLLAGSTIVLYDGSPTYPDGNVLWDLAEKAGITHFGTSAAFINICMKLGLKPKEQFDLSKLEAVLSTGSPLTVEGFAWVYENVKEDICLASCSGGTDVCTAFVVGSPFCRCAPASSRAARWARMCRRLTKTAGRLSMKSVNLSSRSRCRRCRSFSGTIQTANGIGTAILTRTRASGSTATGLKLTNKGDASFTDAPTRRSTAPASAWARAKFTVRSKRSTGCSKASLLI
ncbi:Acetyl-coenzyme A synthetase [Geobacillus sp. BCO2]|nr:Acetyl-coenzyme A synthetase [Geobacillus sp. BCO2]